MPSQTIDTLISAHAIVLNTETEQLEHDYSVAIDQGCIIETGPTESLLARFDAQEHIQLTDHILIPGLINAHGHASMTLLRGIANDLPLMEWLNDHIWPAEAKWANANFVEDGTRLAIGEMLKSGTTCFSDMYFFPDQVAKVVEQTGIRAQIVCPILDFPTVWASDANEYIEKALSLSKEHKDSPLLNIGLGPHAPYTVSDEPLLKVKELVLEHDLPVQIHCHETKFEVESAQTEQGKRPLERLRTLGLFDQGMHLQCVHMTEVSDEEITWLAETDASIIHCPESNLKLASGFAPLDKYHRAAINVALGTDGAASNNDLDMFGEMRTAALLAKAVAENASAMTAWQTLDMATRGGAKALGIWDSVGSLEAGKRADIVAINLKALNTHPNYDLIGDLVYSVHASQVSDVWVNGQQLVKNYTLTTLDEDALLGTASQWAEKIKERDTNA